MAFNLIISKWKALQLTVLLNCIKKFGFVIENLFENKLVAKDESIENGIQRLKLTIFANQLMQKIFKPSKNRNRR